MLDAWAFEPSDSIDPSLSRFYADTDDASLDTYRSRDFRSLRQVAIDAGAAMLKLRERNGGGGAAAVADGELLSPRGLIGLPLDLPSLGGSFYGLPSADEFMPVNPSNLLHAYDWSSEVACVVASSGFYTFPLYGGDNPGVTIRHVPGAEVHSSSLTLSTLERFRDAVSPPSREEMLSILPLPISNQDMLDANPVPTWIVTLEFGAPVPPNCLSMEYSADGFFPYVLKDLSPVPLDTAIALEAAWNRLPRDTWTEFHRNRVYTSVLARYRASQTINGHPLFPPDPIANLRCWDGRYVRYSVVDIENPATVDPPPSVVVGTPIPLGNRFKWYPVDARSTGGRIGWFGPHDPPYPSCPSCLLRVSRRLRRHRPRIWLPGVHLKCNFCPQS